MPKRRSDTLFKWMADYLDHSALDGWVVGVSGGIDSAVTSTLAALTGRPTTAAAYAHPSGG